MSHGGLNCKCNDTPVITHYGIPGMKWGVRRSKEELRYNKQSIKARLDRNLSKIAAKNGVLVRSVADHFTEYPDDRKDRRVNADEIIDALKNPLNYGVDLDKIRYSERGEKSLRYVGKTATVNVNPDKGVITTAWVTGRQKREKYEKKGASKHVY